LGSWFTNNTNNNNNNKSNNNNKRDNMHTDRCDNGCRQKCRAKGSGKEVKMQEFRYRGIMNVEPEMYDYTGSNWSHWNSNEKLKEKFGRYTRETLDRFTKKRQLYLEHHT
jgi:hypothetical protein